MTTLDPRLEEQFDRFVPDAAVEGDWEAIVRGARRRARRRRLVQLGTVAAVFVLGASPVGGAIAGGVADFSAWLRGEPGSPAADSDQQAFERSNSRSWAGFPQATKLRSLIKTEVGGHEFELFGFRAGGSLCLRVVGRGLNNYPAVSCAPLGALRDADAPVLVVEADHGFGLADQVPPGQDYVAPQAQATFGFVADGVEGVELQADDGSHRAIVASNAFLYVADKPKFGTRVRRVQALLDDGRRLAVPFQAAAFGESEPPSYGQGQPTGPTVVERDVEGGHIGWLKRREPRGEPPPAALGGDHFFKNVEFSRLLTPDPESHMRVLVAVGEPAPRYSQPARMVCASLVSGGVTGGGCSPMADLFSSRPFTTGETLLGGGDQYATLSGLASDDVARMRLFLATGKTYTIPLRDNAWLIQAARADYPVRIVAYDQAGHVIGIEAFG